MTDERIIELLLRMEERQNRFLSGVMDMLKGAIISAAPGPSLPAGSGQAGKEDWLDMYEVEKILNVCRRTVFRIRRDNQVKWTQVRGTTLFYAPDIFALKNRYMK